jgi:hypothetical protein
MAGKRKDFNVTLRVGRPGLMISRVWTGQPPLSLLHRKARFNARGLSPTAPAFLRSHATQSLSGSWSTRRYPPASCPRRHP